MGDERTVRIQRASVMVGDRTRMDVSQSSWLASVDVGGLLLSAPSWPELRRFTADLAMAVGERAAEVEAAAEKAADEPEVVATGDSGF